jgi:hypothetical protein
MKVNGMKSVGALLAGLLLAGLCWPQSASAQGVPPGSYLRSCGEVYLQGDTLVATCQRADGYAERSSLPAVQSCVGDIGNRNGRLTCNYGRGPASPRPYYGARGAPAYGQEWEGRREHCMRMRERLHEIHYRMESAPPWERDRLGTRFSEIRERLRHECWGHWREDE